MVEGAIECVRRGLQSLLALWPLFIVRLVETIVLVVVMIGGFLLALIPIGLNLELADFSPWLNDPEGAVEWILTNAGTVFYLFMAVLVLAGVAVLIHSFFEAGVTTLYLEHIRRGHSFPWSEGWERFSLDAFVQAAISRGWAVFIVYNIVWGVAGAVLLIPLGVMLGVLLILRDSPVAIAFTCLGLVVVVVLAIIVSIVATVWAQVGVTITAGERRGPVEASGRAGELMRARLGVTILTAIIVYAVIFGVSSVFSTFNLGLGALSEVPGAYGLSLALQLVMFVVNSLVSTMIGLWTAAVWAAFVAGPVVRPATAPNGGTLGSGNALVG